MALVTCGECGNQVSDLATACPKCGAPRNVQPVTIVARKKQTSGCAWIVAIIVGVFVFQCARIFNPSPSATTSQTTKQSTGKVDAPVLPDTDGSSANPAHEIMARLPDAQRNPYLTRVIKSAEEPCERVTRNFFQGKDANGNAFWNATCSNGNSYVVQINSDQEGSTSVLACTVLKSINAGECFTKF